MAEHGVFHLRVKEDPYIVVTFLDKIRSKAVVRGGRNPCFNFSTGLWVRPETSGHDIVISVYDRDFVMDDAMGSFNCPISVLCDYDKVWVNLKSPSGKKNFCGQLYLEVEFHSTDFVEANDPESKYTLIKS